MNSFFKIKIALLAVFTGLCFGRNFVFPHFSNFQHFSLPSHRSHPSRVNASLVSQVIVSSASIHGTDMGPKKAAAKVSPYPVMLPT